MRFRIDLKIFIFILLFYFTRQIEIYALIMIFCIIHEFGHLLSGILLGMKPNKIEVMPFGVSISFKLYTKDYNKKIGKANLLELKKLIIAISGPITNLIIILAFLLFDMQFIKKEIAIYASILIMTFNLLPIYPLDGGRVLKSLIHIFFGIRKAKVITNKTANIMMIIITFLGSIGVYYFKNVAIFIAILFLWWLVICENRRYKLFEKIGVNLVDG